MGDKRKRNHQWDTDRRNRVRELIAVLKSDGCVTCGEMDIRCLDLHHVDPSTKKFEVGTSQYCRSLKSMIEEAAKCIVLCANCHRKLHITIGEEVANGNRD